MFNHGRALFSSDLIGRLTDSVATDDAISMEGECGAKNRRAAGKTATLRLSIALQFNPSKVDIIHKQSLK
jgi:hypothetical protein